MKDWEGLAVATWQGTNVLTSESARSPIFMQTRLSIALELDSPVLDALHVFAPTHCYAGHPRDNQSVSSKCNFAIL